MTPTPLVRGTVVVDELVIPIVDVYLDRGLIYVVAETRGPLPAGRDVAYRVHGRDGQLVYATAPGITGLNWDPVPAGTRLTVVCPLQVHDVTPTRRRK